MSDDSGMDDNRSSDGRDRATELGAAEIMTPRDFETEQPSTSATQPPTSGPALRTCSNCGRMVEPGFKFCDGCGTKLEPLRLERSPEKPKDEAPPLPREDKPLLERWRERRKNTEAADARPAAATPATAKPPVPAQAPPPLPREDKSLFDRLRERRKKTEQADAPPPVTTPSLPATPTTPAEETTRRVAIAGRLRSKDKKRGSFRPARPAPPPSWRPVPSDAERVVAPERPLDPATFVLFVAHVLIAFVIGLVVLGVIAGVAAVASEGRWQLLDTRGLPIFIAGASAIIVFALLRTSGREGSRSRAGGIVGVLVGFVALIVGAAILLQPGLAGPEQRRLERVLRVFGPGDVDAAKSFKSDIREWNAGSGRFQASLLTLRRGDSDLVRFRADAIDAEGALTGTVATMRSHAESVKNARLRDALDDLTAVYEDRLAAFRVVATGFIGGDQKLVEAGNARYQESKARAEEVFTQRLRPLLEDANVNADSFGVVIAGAAG
jgi:hypothetical protein